MIWNKSKNKEVKRADTKKASTGFTVLLIPNSSDSAKTVEISYERLLMLLTGALATAIIVIGLLCSMFVHNRRLKSSLARAESSITDLRDTNTMLEGTVSTLNDQIEADKEIFSKIEDSITQKQAEEAVEAEEAAVPNEIPVKNAKAILIEDPYINTTGGRTAGLVFSTVRGAVVAAAAEGIVTHVDSDEENPYYKRGIVIDHQNGYITYYRFNGDVSIEEGASVQRNDVLAVLSEDGFVAFEIKKDGVFINPETLIKEE